jgi:hypothetical protein
MAGHNLLRLACNHYHDACSVCVSIRQVVQDLLHTLLVLVESRPAMIGETDHGMWFLAPKFLFDGLLHLDDVIPVK